MAQLTVLGKEIKKKLVDIEQTQAWLIEQVKGKTGLFFDGSYLHKIMVGERAAPQIVQAIRDVLSLPDHEDRESGEDT
jgi:hypothetical protein